MGQQFQNILYPHAIAANAGTASTFSGSTVIRSAYDIQLEFNLLPGYRKTPWLHLNGNAT
jgi:hypothetical protein